MNFNKRVQDVSQVFDSRWNANHNYQEKKQFLDNRKEHFNKMYNIQDKDVRKQEILRANSVNGKIEGLNQRMGAVNSNERLARRNDFKSNFR